MALNLKLKILFAIIAVSLLFSCAGERRKNNTKSIDQIQEDLIEYNKNSAVFEEEVIKKYIADHNLVMERTGTGLWYLIKNQGEGSKLEDGQMISLDFKVYMLNDSLCYSSEVAGPNKFILGMSDIESGIQEGVKFLNVGGAATFIVPSHLAHGLLGDMNKIPPKTPVIYDINVLEGF